MSENRKTETIGNVVLDYTYYPGEDLYSEGFAEDQLLEYVKIHTESDYEQHIQGSRSWSVMYHLSHIRENVVSWLPIREHETVLEIGSGCGAITGAFCRTAKKVTCVELSRKRSLINAYRHKEFDNLEIHVGNFEAIEPNLNEKYDYISLIGVYEYAASYISGENPYDKFLEILKDHLNPGGKIIIAIENRLGLKYFAGCKEDHLGEYFKGITGYNSNDGVRTFSKRSLEKYLKRAGLNYKFYYPYPDYKLPHTIYSDDKLPSVGELNTNIRNFDADRMVLFDEGKAYDTFIEEGTFPEFSNSFIVLASITENWEENTILPFYVKYANERLEKYRINTLVGKRKDEKFVFKRALSTKANGHIKNLCNNRERLLEQFGDTGLRPIGIEYFEGHERGIPIIGVASTARDLARIEYLSGISMEDYLNELEANEEYEKMEELILEFCKKLNNTTDIVDFRQTPAFGEIFGKREFAKNYLATNPCNYDMIFSNIVFDSKEKENGVWNVLDYEWVFDFPIPIQFIIYRALFYQFRDKEDGGFSTYLSKKGLDVYSLCGIDMGERNLFREMEHSFQVYIIGGVASLDVMRILMPSSTLLLDQIVSVGTYLRNLDTPKVYFSRASTFTEDNQITLIAKNDNNTVNFRIPFDRYVASVRIDPTDYPCIINVKELKYKHNDGTTTKTDNIIVNGYEMAQNVYLFNTNDPQLVLENVPSDAKSLEVSYVVTMLEMEIYDAIAKRLEEDDKINLERKKSVTYRAKKKLGLSGFDDAPIGYRRVKID